MARFFINDPLWRWSSPLSLSSVASWRCRACLWRSFPRSCRRKLASRRPTPGRTPSPSSSRSLRRWNSLCAHAAVDSRAGQRGWFLVLVTGSQRRVDRLPQRASAAVPHRLPPTPGAYGSRLTVLRLCATNLRGCGLGQGAEARGGSGRCLSDTASLPWLPLSQLVQPLRPAVACVPPGG